MPTNNPQDDAMFAQLSAQVYQGVRRFTLLQSDAQEVSTLVFAGQRDTKKQYASLNVTSKLLEEDINALREELNGVSEQVRKFSTRFRYLVKVDLLTSLQKRVDALPYERLIGRAEFERLLQMELSQR